MRITPAGGCASCWGRIHTQGERRQSTQALFKLAKRCNRHDCCTPAPRLLYATTHTRTTKSYCIPVRTPTLSLQLPQVFNSPGGQGTRRLPLSAARPPLTAAAPPPGPTAAAASAQASASRPPAPPPARHACFQVSRRRHNHIGKRAPIGDPTVVTATVPTAATDGRIEPKERQNCLEVGRASIYIE